jgi:uncharacterized membrane protein
LLRSSFLTIKGLFTFTQSYCHSAWPIKSKQSSSLSESPQCSQYSSIQKSNKSFLPHRCLNVHHHSPSSAAVHAFLTPVEIQLGTIAALQMSVISLKGQWGGAPRATTHPSPSKVHCHAHYCHGHTRRSFLPTRGLASLVNAKNVIDCADSGGSLR